MTRNDYPIAAIQAASTARQINDARRRSGIRPAGTPVGWARARALSTGAPLSLDTIKRTYSYLSRAKVYNSGHWSDRGTISYHLWGGDAMLSWTKKILNK